MVLHALAVVVGCGLIVSAIAVALNGSKVGNHYPDKEPEDEQL